MDEELLETVKKLLFRQGIQSVSMDDIAVELGMSKKTLNTYYDSKYRLIEDVVDSFITEIQVNVVEICVRSSNAIEELCEIHQLHYEMNKYINKVFLVDLKKHYAYQWSKVKEFVHEYIIESQIANIEKGKRNKLYREDVNSELSPHIFAETIIKVLLYFPTQNKYTLNELIDSHLVYHIRGVATKKGIEVFNNIRKNKL